MNDPNWWIVCGLFLDIVAVVLIGNCDYGEGPFAGTGPSQANLYGWLNEDQLRVCYWAGWTLLAIGFALQLLGQFFG